MTEGVRPRKGSRLRAAGCGRRSEEVVVELPRSFPVTDDELDAPDGAVVDGYERVGNRWVWVEGKTQNPAEWKASRRNWGCRRR